MSDQERIAALEKANAELRERLNALEQPKPEVKPEPFKDEWKPRRDLTEGMSMDRSTMLEFAAAASAGGIANDSWRRLEPSSIIPQEPKVEIVRGSGWRPETPLGPPEGLRWVEQQLDAQAARDKAELAKKLSDK